MNSNLKLLRGLIRETVRHELRRKLIRENAQVVAAKVAKIASQPGDMETNISSALEKMDYDMLKSFTSMPTREGIALMMRLGVEPSRAKEVWLKAWQAASVIAYPDSYGLDTN